MIPIQLGNSRKFDGNKHAAIAIITKLEFVAAELYLLLRIDQPRSESVENVSFSSHSSVHTISFSNCAI